MSSPTDLQEKIAAARREAEVLKEKIRAKRDQLADTSRTFRPPLRNLFVLFPLPVFSSLSTLNALSPIDRVSLIRCESSTSPGMKQHVLLARTPSSL